MSTKSFNPLGPAVWPAYSEHIYECLALLYRFKLLLWPLHICFRVFKKLIMRGRIFQIVIYEGRIKIICGVCVANKTLIFFK